MNFINGIGGLSDGLRQDGEEVTLMGRRRLTFMHAISSSVFCTSKSIVRRPQRLFARDECVMAFLHVRVNIRDFS